MTTPKVCDQKFTCAATGPMKVYQCALPRGHDGECDDHPTRAAFRVEAGDRVLEVLAEIMEMAPIRHTLGLNHTYESGCRCLRCAADSAIESGQSAMNAQERELKSTLSRAMVNLHQASLAIAEAERLLAERGGTI